MSKPIIEVRNLSKRYRIEGPIKKEETLAGQVLQTLVAPIKNLRNLRRLNRFKEDDETTFWALRDINFEVLQGEVLGIIGHNGAGKSTLLKLLSRITEPTTGEIILRGRVNSLLEVGTGFHPDLSGRDNIYMNGTILGMTKKEIDQKLDEIIDFSGVAKYIDTPVKRYSSGMTVRLAFSVAAHLEPEILIIDEVLAVGDAEFQKKCLGKMQEVSGQGRTVLFVSHQMQAVRKLCTRGVLLKKGELLLDSTVENAIKQYSFSSNMNVQTDYIVNDIHLSEFRTTRDKNKHQISILCHQDLQIEGRLSNVIPGERYILLFTVTDYFRQRVVLFSTRLSDTVIHPHVDFFQFQLKTAGINLMPNTYYLSAILLTSSGTMVAEFSNLRHIVVSKSDSFSSLELPSIEDRGIMRIESTWNIN